MLAARAYSPAAALALWRTGKTPAPSMLLAKILTARGLASYEDVARPLQDLLPYTQLKGAAAAAQYLAIHILVGARIRVVADYDCDGATACAIAVRGLRAFGASVDFIVPDRMKHGYGLTPAIVELAVAMEPRPDVLLTVDNGISSHAGVARARELGAAVIVTDHHLPVKNKPLPAAAHVIDPSQPGCEFPSKALAGCGVVWYLLWALQSIAAERGLSVKPGFTVDSLLPLVAVGTVADVVPLDANNRILVQQGLDRIRAGGEQSFPGIDALATAGFNNGCNPRKLLTSDIAFGIGPRINAAGRLESMETGIRCLLTDNESEARQLAAGLNELNGERQAKEFVIADEAFQQAWQMVASDAPDSRYTITAHDAGWHAGVIGIVAGRIKERLYRPTFVLTTDPDTGELKGSGRSIPGVNLKDLLDLVHTTNPGLLRKFGGHAMAAGVTLKPDSYEEFKAAFELQAHAMMAPEVLRQTTWVDGELNADELSVEMARSLLTPPWGQGFPEPAFCSEFTVISAKLTGKNKNQLNMEVVHDGVVAPATRFRHEGAVPGAGDRLKLVYKLSIARDKKGKETLKLLVEDLC